MGYRNFPHFVITIKYDKEDRDYFVLRATIDMDLINRQIYSLDKEIIDKLGGRIYPKALWVIFPNPLIWKN